MTVNYRAVCEPLDRRLLLAAGDPDLTFSGDGRTALNFPGAAFTIVDTAVAPDGKVIVGGTKGGNMAVARLNQDGTVDTTFGNGGLYESTRREKVKSLAVQGDGKIVMGFGVSPFPYVDLAIGRLLATGAGFDAGFGNNGIADAGTERFYSSGINDVAVQRDGKIIGAGHVDNSLFIDHDFAVVRYHANGSLDNTFDGDGVTVHGLGTDLDQATAVTIDYNDPGINPLYGTIVAVGGEIGSDPSGVVEPSRFRIMRLRENGTLDPGFDGDGKLTSPNLSGLGIEYARGVVVQPRGKIVVAGSSISGSDANLAHFLIARYTDAGVLDTSFGLTNTGVSELDLGGRDEAGAIAVGYLGTANNISGANNVIVSGSRNGTFAAVALRGDGRLDLRFSGDGILTTTIPGHAAGLFTTGDLFPPARRFVMAGGNGQVARYVDVGSLISVATFQPNMYEQGQQATSFLVTRTEALPYAETIFLGTSGTATPRGSLRDFDGQNIVFGIPNFSQTQVVIPAGATFVNVILTPIDDTRVEGDETISFTVGTTSSYDASLTNTTTLVVRDNDTVGGPIVTASTFDYQTSPHRVGFTFSQDVEASVAGNDFQVTGPSGNVPFTFAYDNVSNTATLTFAGVLPNGNYAARAIAAGIRNAAGQQMPADSLLPFFFLQGDANHDRAVNLADFGILRANFGGSGKTFAQGDFNYDTLVNLADFGILRGRYGQTLPPPTGPGNLFGGDNSDHSGRARASLT